MKKIVIIFPLTALFLSFCNQTNPSNSTNAILKTEIITNEDKNQIDVIYKFDSSATVDGCSNILLQKISKDRQYELMLEIQFDSIPKYKEIDVIKYSRFIKIYLNKYRKENKYVNEICNDVLYIDKEATTPITYSAISGSLTISYWSDKDNIVSVSTKNLVLQDKSKDKINIPFELFDKIKVGWKGG